MTALTAAAEALYNCQTTQAHVPAPLSFGSLPAEDQAIMVAAARSCLRAYFLARATDGGTA